MAPVTSVVGCGDLIAPGLAHRPRRERRKIGALQGARNHEPLVTVREGVVNDRSRRS